jgi:hypothetical protein
MAKAAKETIAIISNAPPSKGGAIATMPKSGEMQLHTLAFGGWIGSKKDVDFSQFMASWTKLKGQIGQMITDMAAQAFGNMALEQIEVSISVSGEGSIGIATAKGEASIVLTFKKP